MAKLASKPRLQILVGLPGSGKSTWASQQKSTPISSDAVRQLLRDDAEDQSIHEETFALMRQLIRLRVRLGAGVTIVDATNLRAAHRRPWLQLAKRVGAECEAIWFDTPLEECLRRNAARARKVPEAAIRAMEAGFEVPEVREGFQRVVRISE